SAEWHNTRLPRQSAKPGRARPKRRTSEHKAIRGSENSNLRKDRALAVPLRAYRARQLAEAHPHAASPGESPHRDTVPVREKCPFGSPWKRHGLAAVPRQLEQRTVRARLRPANGTGSAEVPDPYVRPVRGKMRQLLVHVPVHVPEVRSRDTNRSR